MWGTPASGHRGLSYSVRTVPILFCQTRPRQEKPHEVAAFHLFLVSTVCYIPLRLVVNRCAGSFRIKSGRVQTRANESLSSAAAPSPANPQVRGGAVEGSGITAIQPLTSPLVFVPYPDDGLTISEMPVACAYVGRRRIPEASPPPPPDVQSGPQAPLGGRRYNISTQGEFRCEARPWSWSWLYRPRR